jgi:hypothetical protein
MQIRRSAAALAATAALGLTGVAVAGPASAAPVVTGGLVAINVSNVLNNNQVIAQVPIGVAANVCGVSVAAVLAAAGGNNPVCTATNNQLPTAFQVR